MTNVTDNETNVIPLVDNSALLERDVYEWAKRLTKPGDAYDTVLHFLDRQEAITERGFRTCPHYDSGRHYCMCHDYEVVELQAKVDELTADLEEARKRHMENEDQLAEENDALIAKVDALEADLNTAELDNNHLREELRRIEQLERDSAYMRLPVDMDGVPIRTGDMVQFVNEQGDTGAPVEVCAVSEHYAYFYAGKHFYNASMCRHVKQDTVESVVEEILDKHISTNLLDRKAIIVEYAERIRKAVEHG